MPADAKRDRLVSSQQTPRAAVVVVVVVVQFERGLRNRPARRCPMEGSYPERSLGPTGRLLKGIWWWYLGQQGPYNLIHHQRRRYRIHRHRLHRPCREASNGTPASPSVPLAIQFTCFRPSYYRSNGALARRIATVYGPEFVVSYHIMRRGPWIRKPWIKNPGSGSQWNSNCGPAMGIATALI